MILMNERQGNTGRKNEVKSQVQREMYEKQIKKTGKKPLHVQNLL